MTLSSQETIFVAVGLNSQYLTQLLCCFSVNWSLLSTVDQTLTNLSSPQEDRRRPSHEKPIPLMRALCAFIKVTYFACVSKSTSQNFRDSSLEAETSKEPFGLNLRSWIWFCIKQEITLCPRSFLGCVCLVRSHKRITLSMPAEATYFVVGWRSRDMIDSLCPLSDLIRQGSYSLCMNYLNYKRQL